MTKTIAKGEIDQGTSTTMVVDHKGQLHSYSPGIERYLAIERGGNCIHELARTGLRTALRSALNKSARNIQAVSQNDLAVRYDGKVHRVGLDVQPMESVEGGTRFFVVTFREIPLAPTQSRQENEWDNQYNLQRVINNQLGLVGMIDRNGILLEVDDQSMSIAGLTREDVIGKHFAECGWWTYDPAVSAKIRESMKRAFAGETIRFDVPLYAKGDRRLMIDFMIAPVRNADGTIEYLIPSGVDISERVKAEDAIRQNELRLSMALRAGGMAAWEWRPEGSYWTDELFELIGASKDRTPCPELFFEQVHPEDLEGIQNAWQRTVDGLNAYEHEFRIVRPDGEVRWIVGVGQIVRDEKGQVARIFGLNWDSTRDHLAAEALRESERRAQEANVAKSEFLANMSHEIRTPMTSILGYADLLLDNESDPERVSQLRTIKRNGSFLLEIINDILDLSKIEADKLVVETERFAAHKVVRDVVSLMQVRADEKGLKFKVEFEGPIPAKIENDSRRLKQILVNLVGNAIKFTESGSVRLVVRFLLSNQSTIQFDVIDTGIGMTQRQQEQLFQPFAQGDASVSRAYGGTGLGLAISRRLAMILGGGITVKSKPGKGSTFSCTIAAGDVSDEEMILPNLAAITDSWKGNESGQQLKCRVLVVDDRRDVRMLTRSFLSKAGAKVDTAEDGQEALEKIVKSMKNELPTIDLILLDMQMPRLDGYQTAAALRKLGYQNPIIALTADAMHGDMNRCIECGCNAYLSKPIDSTELIATVGQYLGTQK